MPVPSMTQQRKRTDGTAEPGLGAGARALNYGASALLTGVIMVGASLLLWIGVPAGARDATAPPPKAAAHSNTRPSRLERTAIPRPVTASPSAHASAWLLTRAPKLAGPFSSLTIRFEATPAAVPAPGAASSVPSVPGAEMNHRRAVS